MADGRDDLPMWAIIGLWILASPIIVPVVVLSALVAVVGFVFDNTVCRMYTTSV